MTCERCSKESRSFTVSWFNTEVICDGCDDRERAHPEFERARRVESEAVMRGDYNFPGVGLPADLKGAA